MATAEATPVQESLLEVRTEDAPAALPAWFRGRDPLRQFLVETQTVSAHYRPLPRVSTERSFPDRPFAEARAFEVGRPLVDEIGYGCSVMARNGSLCPRVVSPGVLLNQAQIEGLLAVISAPRQEEKQGEKLWRRGRSHCESDPQLAIVFYDARQAPLGYVSVDPACSDWQIVPAPRGAWEGMAPLKPEESEAFRKLSAELGFPWSKGADRARKGESGAGKGAKGTSVHATSPVTPPASKPTDSPGESESRAEYQRLLPLLLAESPGVTESKTISETTVKDRRRLCGWYLRGAAVAARAFFDIRFHPQSSFHAPGEPRGVFYQGFAQCLDRFPKCSDTVGKSLRCLSATLTRFTSIDPACRPECLWGASSVSSPADAEDEPSGLERRSHAEEDEEDEDID